MQSRADRADDDDDDETSITRTTNTAKSSRPKLANCVPISLPREQPVQQVKSVVTANSERTIRWRRGDAGSRRRRLISWRRPRITLLHPSSCLLRSKSREPRAGGEKRSLSKRGAEDESSIFMLPAAARLRVIACARMRSPRGGDSHTNETKREEKETGSLVLYLLTYLIFAARSHRPAAGRATSQPVAAADAQ